MAESDLPQPSAHISGYMSSSEWLPKGTFGTAGGVGSILLLCMPYIGVGSGSCGAGELGGESKSLWLKGKERSQLRL